MAVKGEALYKLRLKELAALPLAVPEEDSIHSYPRITVDLKEAWSDDEDARRWDSVFGVSKQELQVQRRENLLHDVYRSLRPQVLLPLNS